MFEGQKRSQRLSTAGKIQAQRLASLLKPRQPTEIYCSTMPSAIATVAPLFTHDDIDADMQYCNWLREVDTGDWEGLSHGQASDRDPVAMENYLRDPGQHQFPRGEHLLAAYERATVAFRELICRERKQSSRIVLVGHAMINRLLLTDYCGATLLEHRHIDQVAGNFTVLRYAFGETELQAIGAAVV